jgi:hypothetical protein
VYIVHAGAESTPTLYELYTTQMVPCWVGWCVRFNGFRFLRLAPWFNVAA